MAKFPPFSEDEEGNYSPLSSSSLRFSTEDDDEESDGVHNGRKRGKTFEELAEEAIRDMRKAEEDERQELRGMYEMGEPSQPAARVNNEDPHEGLIREMIDLTGTDDEVDAEEDDWRRTLDETVDVLVVEVAEQREQTTRLANLMERVVSWMDRETQSSNNPLPATSVAPLAGSQQPNTDAAETSRTRKKITTTSQSPATKRTRHSGSPGGQKKN